VEDQVLGFQISHLAVGDLDAFGVDGVVKFGVDGEAGAGGGAGDQVDDDFVASQRLAAPVHRGAARRRGVDRGAEAQLRPGPPVYRALQQDPVAAEAEPA
jgi:hypothetical protein